MTLDVLDDTCNPIRVRSLPTTLAIKIAAVTWMCQQLIGWELGAVLTDGVARTTATKMIISLIFLMHQILNFKDFLMSPYKTHMMHTFIINLLIVAFLVQYVSGILHIT